MILSSKHVKIGTALAQKIQHNVMTQNLRYIAKDAPAFDLLSMVGNDGCLLWDVKEAACTGCLEGPAVRWASYVDDGKRLLCASGNRTTKLWDLSTSSGRVALEGTRGSRVKSWSASQVWPATLHIDRQPKLYKYGILN